MYQFIIVVHVLLGLGVIGLVLMQQGKGADAGAAFGTGSSGSVFGAQGAASFLSRTTAILATLFFSTSLGLAVLGSHQGRTKDLMDTAIEAKQKKAPVPSVNDSQATAQTPVATDVPVTPTITERVPATAEKPATVDSNSKIDENSATSHTKKKESSDAKPSDSDSKKGKTGAKQDKSHKKANEDD